MSHTLLHVFQRFREDSETLLQQVQHVEDCVFDPEGGDGRVGSAACQHSHVVLRRSWATVVAVAVLDDRYRSHHSIAPCHEV